jgi:nucleoside-diphosphate-sugar epimerase
MVTINGLAEMLMQIAGKKLTLRHVPGPVGVRGRNSDNTLIEKTLGWRPREPLIAGLRRLYPWILARVQASR